jgi:cell division protein FtsN
MPQDYKNVSRARSPKAKAGISNAVLPFLAGLSIGLLVAFAIFLYQYQRLLQGEAPQITVHNAVQPAGTDAQSEAPESAPEQAVEPPAPTFDFYQILPNREVSLSEWEADSPAAGTEDPSADKLFILQVGSFKTTEAADQIKAQLALLGIEADVQRVVINGQDVVHRVRIGPFKDKKTFEDTRQRLIANDLDFVVLKLKAGEAETQVQ